MKLKPVFFNVVPSPPDVRDWNFEPIVDANISHPRSLNLYLSPIRNQMEQGSSAAQVGAAIAEYQMRKNKTWKKKQISAQFIHDLKKEEICGRDIMRILATKGTCLETTHPYDSHEISQKTFEEATETRIPNYARVHTILSLKRALFVNGPCYMSVPVYNHNVKMWVQHKGERRLGGHAFTVVGYDSRGFILRNSWGVFWKRKGYCHFPYTDWGCQQEVWTVISPRSYLIPRWKTISWTLKQLRRFRNLFRHISETPPLSTPPDLIFQQACEEAEMGAEVEDAEAEAEDTEDAEASEPKLEDIFPEPPIEGRSRRFR